MRKIVLGTLLIALMAAPALALTGGGKKKAKKKARVECKSDKCDPKDCDPRNCDYKDCQKEEKCSQASACSGS